jgi:hypothetical protein
MREEDKQTILTILKAAKEIDGYQIEDAIAALDRLTAEPGKGRDMGRIMEEYESCENKDCRFFDEECDQNCAGATDYESPAAEECTDWGKRLTTEPQEDARKLP